MRELSLYGLQQLALIIAEPSSVLYSNQVGGTACDQQSCEGVLAVIDDELGEYYSFLKEYTQEKARLSSEDADKLDEKLNGTSLTIDREMLSESKEAWIHVIIDNKEAYNGFSQHGIITWDNSD